MKKMLTTLMVLAFALSAASALAGDMDWSFYGKLHSSINYLSWMNVMVGDPVCEPYAWPRHP